MPLPQNYVIRPPTLVTDFSSTTGMTLTQGTGSVVLDPDQTKVRIGSQSLRITQLANSFSAYVDLDCRNTAFGGTGSEGFLSVADGLFHLRSFVDTPANQGTLNVFLSNTAAGFADYFSANVLPSQVSSNSGWTNSFWDRVEHRKDWTSAGGVPSWGTPIRTIRLRPNSNVNGPLTTWFDGLWRGGYARPKILITFDDSNTEQYTIAKPVLDEFGIKATFYLIADSIKRNIAGSLSEVQARTLYDQGHALAFHQWTNTYNNYGELTPAELDFQIDSWFEYASSMEWTRAMRHLAYPQGVSSEVIRAQVAARGFQSARSTLRLPQNHLFGLDNPYALRCYTWSATDGTAGPISWMQSAVIYGTTINIAFHQHHATISTGAQISTPDLRTILRTAKQLEQAGLADIVTHDEWFNGLTRPIKMR